MLKCLFCCVKTCGCRDAIARKYAFLPPVPPSYSLIPIDGEYLFILSDENGKKVSTLAASWIKVTPVVLTTRKNERIPALHFENMQANFTMVYSHGNCTDIGWMRDFLFDIAVELRASILVYEYTGYGQSSGKPSESNMNADISAAYHYLIKKGVEWSQIVLYGQSIGSGPTCYLGCREPVAGVILHSPLASGAELLKKKFTKPSFLDIFPNLLRVPYIRAPVFLIHGVKDREIPFEHSIWISERVHLAWKPWFVKAGHHDIEVNHRVEYLQKMREFLSALESLQEEALDEVDLEEMFRPFNLQIPIEDLPCSNLFWPDKHSDKPETILENK